ncbi:MAG: hypothetical protein U1F87_11460 [Kiritimatiellia bacterium]
MMKHLLPCLPLLMLQPLSGMAQAPQTNLIAAARAQLETWRAEPEAGIAAPTGRVVIAYWTPADREPAPRHEERLSAILKDIQEFYAREMDRRGFGRMTFRLEEGPEGRVLIHPVRGTQPYAHYKVESGDEIRRDVEPVLLKEGVDPARNTVVIFCNMSNWDPEQRTISQNSPYYASGSHIRGTAWQVDSPILELSGLKEKGAHVQDGQYGRISLGRYNSYFIGGIAHELGHALGLPHVRESRAQAAGLGTALMGNGNRTYGEESRDDGKGSFLMPEHALRLASHPLFTRSTRDIDAKAGTKISGWTFNPDGRGAKVTGRVSVTGPAVYAILGYVDPDGGQDYDSSVCMTRPAADGTFELDASGCRFGNVGEFKVVCLHVNGAATSYSTTRTPHAFRYERGPGGLEAKFR